MTQRKAEVRFLWDQQKLTTYRLVNIHFVSSKYFDSWREEHSVLYFNTIAWLQRKPFLLATSITHFHTQKEHTLVLKTARIATLQVQPFPLSFFFGHIRSVASFSFENAHCLYFISTQAHDYNGNLTRFATLHATTCSVGMFPANKDGNRTY